LPHRGDNAHMLSHSSIQLPLSLLMLPSRNNCDQNNKSVLQLPVRTKSFEIDALSISAFPPQSG